MKGIRRLFRIRNARSIPGDIDDELRFHIETRVDALVAQGMTTENARRQALAEFGDVNQALSELSTIDRQSHTRRARAEWWSDIAQDARVALRSYLRRPGFTVVVLLTMGLGIGANSAIFSVAEAVLLRGLPYRDAEQLVHVWETKDGNPNDLSEASYPDFVDWRALTDVFSHVEGYNETNVTVQDVSGAARGYGARVTAGFFGMLGVQPVLGRAFAAGEDGPNGSPIVIVSHDYWERQLGADPRALGRTLDIDDAPHTVIGVLPRGFHFAAVGDAQLWFPLDGSAQRRQERFNHWVNVVARMRPDVALETARSRMAEVMQRLAMTYPETNDGRGVFMVPLRDAIVGPVRPMLLVLFGAVVIVLLIACANVASLVLARSIERAGEIAVRTALGASRARLLRQLVTENVLLALAGGVLGVWVASLGLSALLRFATPEMFDQMPALRDVGLNGRVLAYSLGLAALAGIGFGLVPALAVTGGSTALLLRGARSSGANRGRQRLRDALVAAEIACTLVLVVGAVLMTRSVRELLRVDPGFVADRVATARIALAGPRYREGIVQQRYFEDVIARVTAMPGVEAAGAVSQAPLQGGGTNTFRVEGQPEPPASSRPEATMRGVAGDYFVAMGITVHEGRAFNADDDSLARPVIMVSSAIARRLFRNGGAVGSRVRFYAFPESSWTIIGVVADVKTASLDAPAPPTIYYTHLQGAENRMTVVARVRDGSDASTVVGAIRRAATSVDPTMPVYQAGTMQEQIEGSSAVDARRYPLVLIMAFAIAALTLAMIGVYGVIAYSVAQRVRELAIRTALGAQASDVLRLVIGRGLGLAAAGVALGVPAALLLSRGLESLLYGVSPSDTWTYVTVAALLAMVAALASYIPARRATRIDPALALRSE
jgi:putative ABC transport system permease protein